MQFRFNKFIDNIQEFQVNNGNAENCIGIARVINIIINKENAREIDFESFTLEDIYVSLDCIMQSVELCEDDDEEYIVIPNEPLATMLAINSIMFDIINSNNKIYRFEDKEDFI